MAATMLSMSVPIVWHTELDCWEMGLMSERRRVCFRDTAGKGAGLLREGDGGVPGE